MNRDGELKLTSPGRAALVLGRPALHCIVATAFALVFTWPILAFDVPLNTWSFLYASWVVAIGVLFAFSRGEEATETDDVVEEQVENSVGKLDAVASVPAAKSVSIRPGKAE